MSGVGGEGPGGLAGIGNDQGDVTGRADEVSAGPDAPQGAPIAATTAYGDEAASVGMVTEGGDGEAGGLEELAWTR